MRKLMIAPSVGCCDLFRIEEQVRLINEKSDYLHMDIKDGVYVPSYGIGPDYLDYLNKHVENLKPMDAHLMVKHPQQYLEVFAKAGAAYITPHTDCIEGDAFVTIRRIKELGCKAGIALSPSVPLSTIEYYLPLLDKVTIMIVDPGISGQPVDPQMFVKINRLAKMRKELGLNFLIEADGSMNKSLYRPLYEAGADMVVLGPPALWNKDEDFKKAWSVMENELEEELKTAACKGITAIDTIGAGDNFASGFIAGILQGKDIHECAVYANCTAAISVQYSGATAGVQNKEMVEQMLKKYKEDYIL